MGGETSCIIRVHMLFGPQYPTQRGGNRGRGFTRQAGRHYAERDGFFSPAPDTEKPPKPSSDGAVSV